MNNLNKLEKICKLIRYYIIKSTTAAGSGHPTSSLSAVELTAGLVFGKNFRYKIHDPKFCNNDRLIFSKGHASPLLYAVWAAAGALTEKEIMGLRKFNSRLEGHPTPSFEHAEAATGSLGQGLSIGAGMALNAKYVDMLPYRTYVLMGDSEMSEGSIWEAIQIASHYELNNLVGIIDVNGLGQSGWTMYGHNMQKYADMVSAFGWDTIQVDGHNLQEVISAFDTAVDSENKPVMIIAGTVKGKGISFLENKHGWHGKILTAEESEKAIKEIGIPDKSFSLSIPEPEDIKPYKGLHIWKDRINIKQKNISTRKAYGIGLSNIFPRFPNIVVLDSEVSNSTYSEIFKDSYPNNYFEMFVAEQNMIGSAIGLSARGKIPFVSSFAAFLSRAYDQIRMSQYSSTNIKFVGSHSGVSIGPDGPSQMGLEDIAMFRANHDMAVLYPADATSTIKLVERAAEHYGNVYIRTTRMDIPVIYDEDEDFHIGRSKTLKSSNDDQVTVCGAGITVHQALKAYRYLEKQGIYIRVLDIYSIKPIDRQAIKKAACQTKAIITVEDHFAEGGLGEAVCSAVSDHGCPVHMMAVRKLPRSGSPEELIDYEEISSDSIVEKVKEMLSK